MSSRKRPSSAAGPTYLEGLSPAQLAFWLAKRPARERLLVVAADDDATLVLQSDLSTLTGEPVFALRADDASPFSLVAADAQAAYAQGALREALLEQRLPRCIVISAAAAQGTWPPLADYAAMRMVLEAGREVDRDALVARLSASGYLRVNAVEDEGTFAVRGGVIDIFPPAGETGEAAAFRVDLFGDEIASIEQLGAADGRRRLERLVVAPIREVVFAEAAVERACDWLDAAREHSNVPSRVLRERREAISAHRFFFGIESMWPAFYGESRVEGVLATLAAQVDCVALADGHASVGIWKRREADAAKAREKAERTQGPQVRADSLVVPAERLEAALKGQPLVWHGPALLRGETPARHALGTAESLREALAERRRKSEQRDLLRPLVQALGQSEREGGRAYVLAAHHGAALRLRELLAARGRPLPVLPALPPLFDFDAAATAADEGRPAVGLCVAPLSSSVEDRARGLLLVSDTDVFGSEARPVQKARAKKPLADALNALDDLHEGDCVIHRDHGVGRYMGLSRLVLDGVDGDFVQLEYADGDKLYLPVYRLGVLHRYHGLHSSARLDKLGSGRFEKAKRRVRDAVLSMAHAMLALEARRKSQQGHAFAAPDERYAEFEAGFPFDETPDQRRAIDDTLADLQKPVPMDRLICGDVGFGKTEVALRAAFLAVNAGKQVALLGPTTVLVEQHRETFAARLAPFAVEVASLSRFTPEKHRRELFARTKAGHVDVLVGTHRLLSQDLQFKDLGLLIVDEEQRFGVKHKERLKQLRAHVHVLTMSATPIPRTLHMATSGMRQLSVISTPPQSRMPIVTEVLRQDEEVLREAIERERTRGGQTFVVYNRVEGIERIREMVQRLVPDAKVLLAHGQMDGKALAAVMEQFVHSRADVLVSTAIIESGIDIPSVNTMVVLDAHHYGLSQLYQLRGRIGRSRQRAYAYLMLPPEVDLGKDVAERMRLLKRFSTLGAGFQVASHDLEMRGAGDLLGSDQSGHIAAVGFELYTQLLDEAMQSARGGERHETVEPDIKLPVAAVFPERYIHEPLDRLSFYQKMSQAPSDEAIFAVLGEVGQVFGPPPKEAEALAQLMVLRRRLQALGVTHLTAAMDADSVRMGVTFAPDAAVDRQALLELCQAQPGAYRALPSGRLSVRLPLPPLQPADPDRGQDVDFVADTDLLLAVRGGLEALALR